jgi:hypothetical protein
MAKRTRKLTGTRPTRRDSGPRPRGGRPKGVKNKSTIERELNAAQVIDRARREGRDLAVTVLENLMNIALGATGLNRPTPKGQEGPNGEVNPNGDWDRFGAWFDRTAYCAKELARYQSPTIKPMEQPTAAPTELELERDGTRTFTLQVFEGGKALPPP